MLNQINGVEAGTDFNDVSETYTCPVCESGKDSFDLLIKDDILSHG